MSGTKAGGLKAAITNKQRHGNDFYKKIGEKGGKLGHTGGFAANPALARIAGAKGGKISRRSSSTKINELVNQHSKKIMEMLEQGYSVRDVAKETNIPYSTLRYRLNKTGVLEFTKGMKNV